MQIFIDFENAYDRSSREILLNKLKRSHYIQVIKNIYELFTPRMRIQYIYIYGTTQKFLRNHFLINSWIWEREGEAQCGSCKELNNDAYNEDLCDSCLSWSQIQLQIYHWKKIQEEYYSYKWIRFKNIQIYRIAMSHTSQFKINHMLLINGW